MASLDKKELATPPSSRGAVRNTLEGQIKKEDVKNTWTKGRVTVLAVDLHQKLEDTAVYDRSKMGHDVLDALGASHISYAFYRVCSKSQIGHELESIGLDGFAENAKPESFGDTVAFFIFQTPL